MARPSFGGHKVICLEDEKKWVYADDKSDLPANGGRMRPCVHCGEEFLNEDDPDPCLGNLPGVDNACCGHGIRDAAYIQFSNGVSVKGFVIAK